MITKTKSFIKNNVLNTICFILITTIIFSEFIFKDTNYIIGYDIKNLFEPYYAEFKRVILNGELPFWSHNFFLGVNLIASKSYIFLGDIFSYFIFIFKNLPIMSVIFIIQPIKCIVSYTLMRILLKEFDVKDKLWLFLFPTIYAFSGYVMIFLGCLQFMSFYTLAPLLFIAIEKYLKNGKFILIPISSLLLLGSTYYLFWSLCVFLVFYWPIRYFIYYKEIKIKDFVVRSIILVFFFCLGVALYAPILIPTVEFIKNSSRVMNNESTKLFWDLERYFDIIIKSISSPVYVSSNMPNFFDTNYYRTEQVTLFSSSICTLMVPQFLAISDKKTKCSLLIFYAIMTMLLVFEPGGSLMHGLSESSFRWTFLPIMINIIVSAKLLDEKIFNKKIFIITAFLLVLISGFILFKVGNIFDYKYQLFFIVLGILEIILMGLSLSFNKLSQPVIVLLVLIELITGYKVTMSAKLNTNNNNGYDYKTLNIPDNYFEDLQERNGNEFYRIFVFYDFIDIDYVKQMCFNSNMVLNFKSVYGYDSTRQTSINAFMNLTDQYYWWFEETNPKTLDFLSTKYTITKSKYELTDDDWTLVERIGDSDFYLYENNNYKPFGFTASSLTSSEDFYASLDGFNQYDVINDSVFIDQILIDAYNLNDYISNNSGHANLVLDKLSNNYLKGSIKSESNEIVVLTIPSDKGWKIKADGVDQNYIVADGGFMAIPVTAGEHTIELSFTPFGWNIGLKLSAISLILLLSSIYINKKTKIISKII